MKLGELIAIARECKGWTLRDLERESGISNALISQIERGHVKDPGFSTVVRLARCLGLSVDRCASTVINFRDVLRRSKATKKQDTTMKKPFEEALAELQDQYLKAGGKGGDMKFEEINELLRSQIQANEESGEE